MLMVENRLLVTPEEVFSQANPCQ